MSKRRLSMSHTAHSAKRSNANKTIFDNGMEAINKAIDHLDSIGTDTTDTIQQATAMLNELEEARAHLFSIRAQARGRQGGFEKAIEDATRAIDASPTSGQFYQLAGELHIAHGKPKLAVKVLEAGLRSAFPSDWPSLYNDREVAQRISEARVDFVSIMPPEVVARIFSCLNSVDEGDRCAFNCTLVSKHWRVVALGCSRMWKIAKYSIDLNGAFLLLPSVSSYVEGLEFDEILQLLPEKPARKLITLAACGKLQSVTKLTLGYYRSRIDLHLLLALGKQITELKLDTKTAKDEVFSLSEILAACKNLKALTVLCSRQRIQYQPCQMSTVETLRLEMLSIRAGFDDYDFLQQLIPQCRQLRFLNIGNCSQYIPGLVAMPYSQLEEICIMSASDSFGEIWEKAYQKHQPPTTGLRTLEFISGESGIRLQDLMPLWTKWNNTLQELVIEMSDDDIETMEQMHWDSLVSGPYPHLKSLRLVSTDREGSHVTSHVARLLQSCPALEDLNLYIKDMSSNDLFPRFDALPCLRRLHISYLEACEGLQKTFEYLSTRDGKCNLKEVSIDSCEAVTDQILNALADVPSLEDIFISGPHALVSSNGIKAFLRKLKSNPNLKHLILHIMDNFTEDCIAELDELVQLDGTGAEYKISKYNKRDGTERYNVMFDKSKCFRNKLCRWQAGKLKMTR